MTALFKGPKMTAPPPPTPQVDQIKKARDELDEFMRRRGAGTNILTSESGIPNLGTTVRRKLYGAAA